MAVQGSSQSWRFSAAPRANVHRRTRSGSTPTRPANRSIVAPGASSIRSVQFRRCWVASKAGSPTNGFGSMTSHGSRRAESTLPAWRSVANRTWPGTGSSLSAPNARSPSRTSPGSSHRAWFASVSSIQRSTISASGRNGCGESGTRHIRRSRPAITTSCSSSGDDRSQVSGTHRSSSIAPDPSSASSSRTVGSPSQNRSPSISWFASMCGIEIFSTAGVPSDRTAGATQAALTSGPSKGCSTSSDHRRSRSRTTLGNRSSHSIRSGSFRQLAASDLGIVRDTRHPGTRPSGRAVGRLRIRCSRTRAGSDDCVWS